LDYRQISRKLGILILLVGVCMSSSLSWAFADSGAADMNVVIGAFVRSIAVSVVAGIFLIWIGRGRKDDAGRIYRREAVAIVGLGWFCCGILGALPYIFSGVLKNLYGNWFDIVAAAIFESISGFTGTGASVFPDVEILPRAILFWRSLTHWLGGMGIVVLFVAVLGQTGPAAKYLFNSEMPGPVSEAIRPRVRKSAMLLWGIYIAISAAAVICLWVQGMNLFESLCHTFGAIATGGFSTHNQSIGHYNNLGIELTIILFLVLAGVNFNLYAAILHGKWRSVFKNQELRVYLLLLAGATILISLDLILNRPLVYNAVHALRVAGFQVVSVMTTTGYCTDDFNTWPNLSRWLLVMLMFVGGSAGSTACGIKVIRVMLFVRLILLEAELIFSPNVVRPLTIGRQQVDDNIRRDVSTYVGLILALFFVATLLLMVVHNDCCVKPADHLDLETAFSAVATTLNGVGPGLNKVGAVGNFAFFTAPAKLLLSLLMLLGRLEIMIILVLFMPSFWRQN
jgi:trk system potassium uptake protein